MKNPTGHEKVVDPAGTGEGAFVAQKNLSVKLRVPFVHNRKNQKPADRAGDA